MSKFLAIKIDRLGEHEHSVQFGNGEVLDTDRFIYQSEAGAIRGATKRAAHILQEMPYGEDPAKLD